ncbi:MAG: AAA family ATPase [Proteobacteria bacterium]|nr:AAA family ATPase [Pseudomonadota bacterium]
MQPRKRLPGVSAFPGGASSAALLTTQHHNSDEVPSYDEFVVQAQEPAEQEPQRYVNRQFAATDEVEDPGFHNVGSPEELAEKLATVGYQCLPFVATQISLVLNTPNDRIRALLLEGPSGCGKSFMAKSLAKITGAELMCLSCYKGMPTQNLIESPSTLAMANAMIGKGESADSSKLMNLGILSRAYLKSQEKPVILLIDELDKPDAAIDTFFLGPIQDARIWLESREPIDANVNNILLMFTKNWNRTLDEALLRRVHPIRMTYLDATLERKILSKHCLPQLVSNLVGVADRMRNSNGTYAFERPPAPEELLTAGHHIQKLLEWGYQDFGFIGRSIWATMAKSEHDRAVLEHMMRYHPDFMDPLFPDGKTTPIDEIYARLGRVVLSQIVEDQDSRRREEAWKIYNTY